MKTDYNLLVIDDDFLTLASLKSDLEQEGYRVDSANSGKKALEHLESGEYDLVITDLLLDEIGGLDILKKTKSINPDTAVMILTGHGDPLFVIDALRLEADDFLTKPYETGEILFRVKNCISKVESIRAISKSKHEYSLLATAVAQLSEIVTILSPEGVVIYVNDAYEKISGFDKSHMIGKSIRDMNLRGHLDNWEEVWKQVQKSTPWKGYITERKADGNLIETEATISPIIDSSGNISNIVSVQRDVTHELELERQVRQSRKMEAIGTLAGGIAHDFNNILGAIIGYSEMSLDNVPIGSYIHNNLKQILKASNRAANLVSQILAFSRAKKQEKQPVQLTLLIRETLKMLRSTIPSSIEIRQKHENPQAHILSDPTQMHQVIMNLCTNAAQALGIDGGVLEIYTGTLKLPEGGRQSHIVSHELKNGEYFHLQVIDNGTGMEPWVLERVFDPFFTTKQVGEGTGLGLSMVHGIIKEHGGNIQVQSSPGEGTRVDILLPMVAEKDQIQQREMHAVAQGKGKILIVDDEESLVQIQEEMLINLGYEVTAHTSSTEALETFKQSPDFDLLITDQTMPMMTGLKLTEEILQIKPGLPVILCTGFSESVNEEEIEKKGIKKLIFKPLRRRDLAMTIFELLNP